MLNSKLLWLGLLIAWIAASAYWHVCKILKLCDVDLISSYGSVIAEPVPLAEPLIISDTPEFRLKAKGNFSFAKGGIIANKADVYPEMDSLALYLAANPDKLLTITGFYSAEENNTTIFSNLGLARASEIKNWLLGKGIADSVFFIKSQLKNDIVFNNDSLSGGIQFSVNNKIAPVKKELLSEADLVNNQKFKSIFKPLDLYFSGANTKYIKNDQNLKFILETRKYFSNNNDKKLILTGYTHKDSANWDSSISKRRAVFIKKQFVSIGILENSIIILKKSEPELLDSNSGEKCANCRITMVVK